MSVSEWLLSQSGPEDYRLTDDEFYALEDWINAHKDGLEWPMKNGLLKLFNAEEHRRLARQLRDRER